MQEFLVARPVSLRRRHQRSLHCHPHRLGFFPAPIFRASSANAFARGEAKPDWRQVAVVSWSGMRGIVSLAAALALQGYPNFPRPAPRPVSRLQRHSHHARLSGAHPADPDPFSRRGATTAFPRGRKSTRAIASRRPSSRKIDKVRTERKFPASAIETVEESLSRARPVPPG